MTPRILCWFVIGLAAGAQTITPLTPRVRGLSSPALSPDGAMLAYETDDAIDVRPFRGGSELHFAEKEDEGFPLGPRWSPDGRQIAFLRFFCHNCNHRLFVKAFPAGPERSLGEVCGGAPSWSPDGRFLIATELAGKFPGWGPCRVVLIPLNGSPRIRLSSDGDELAITSDGKMLAYAAGHVVKTVHLDSRYRFADAPVEIAREPHSVSSIHWTPDDRTLVYQVSDYTRAITNGVARLLHPGAKIRISQLLSGDRALGTEDRVASELWRVDLNSAQQEPEKVREVPWTDEDLSASPDGQLIVFTTSRNGPPQVWISGMDGSNARVLISAIPPFSEPGDNTLVDALSWSPDGKWIAMRTQPGIGHGDASARIFVIPSAGGPLRRLVDCELNGRAPVWSEDSRALYVSRSSTSMPSKESYFLADIATGRLTPVGEAQVPAGPSIKLPNDLGQPLFTQGSRFIYFQKPVEQEPRLVIVNEFGANGNQVVINH